MGDVGIDGRSSRHVARSSGLIALVCAEEASVVPLLNRDQRDPWHVVGLQLREKLVIVKVEVGQMVKDKVKSVKVKFEMLGVGNLDASLSDGEQLDLEDFAELAFAHTVPVSATEGFSFFFDCLLVCVSFCLCYLVVRGV